MWGHLPTPCNCYACVYVCLAYVCKYGCVHGCARVCTVWRGVYLLVGMCVVLYMDLCVLFVFIFVCLETDFKNDGQTSNFKKKWNQIWSVLWKNAKETICFPTSSFIRSFTHFKKENEIVTCNSICSFFLSVVQNLSEVCSMPSTVQSRHPANNCDDETPGHHHVIHHLKDVTTASTRRQGICTLV